MIDKIQKLIEELANELVNLKSLMTTVNFQSQDNTTRTKELNDKEKLLSDKEIKIVTTIKENEENKKNLTVIAGQIESKQSKLQDEWDKMLKEKEEWGGLKEGLIKERARLENFESELKKIKDAITEKSSINDKQAESNRTMAQMLKAKEEKLVKDQAKVEKYLNNIL